MQLGMIGLGRMGANMVRRLIKKGHSCVVFDRLNVRRLFECGPLAAGFSVNFWFRDGSGALQEIEVASLVSLLDVLHV
jgi:nucleoside-diphosphate-sugar epimerase